MENMREIVKRRRDYDVAKNIETELFVKLQNAQGQFEVDMKNFTNKTKFPPHFVLWNIQEIYNEARKAANEALQLYVVAIKVENKEQLVKM